MPTRDVLLSQKFNNYNYAPGIATYGIDGKTGITGNDGNNIYFTDCDLINDINNKNLNELAELLRGNYLPVKGSTTIIARSYKNDDLFFDQNGIIYKLKDIDSLLGSGGKDVYEKYFGIAGKISIADYDGYFNKEDNRLLLNSSDFSGFDVITSPNLSTNIDGNAVVNIISNNIDENDNIELVKMQSIDNVDIEDGNLDVYYKTTDNAYYLESNMPIVINSNVKINDNANNIDYDNYSSVLTSMDPITYFKHVCDNLRYNILYDADANQYKIIIFQNDNGRDVLDYIVSRKETVFGKIYSDENGQTLIKLNDVVNGPINDSNKFEHYVATKSINITANVNDFTITHDDIIYNIPNTSIHINKYLNELNNSKSVEISLDPIYVNEVGNLKSSGYAQSSNTMSSNLCSIKLNNAQSKTQVQPFGIAFDDAIQSTKNYISISPTNNSILYRKGQILYVDIYHIGDSATDVSAKLYINGEYKYTSTVKDVFPSSDAAITKNIVRTSYVFEKDATTNSTIQIGFTNSDFRLNKFGIKDSTPVNYSKEFNDKMFTVTASQNRDVLIYKSSTKIINQKTSIKQQTYENVNGVCKFTFNTNDFNTDRIIKLNIKPALVGLTGTPVVLNISIPEDVYGQNSLYFKLKYGEDKFIIDNILISSDNNLITNGNIAQGYQIETYIPGSLDSIDRVALLHNTEVFINYQNYRNDIEQKSEETDYYRKLKGIYLTSYNPYDYNATGELVPDFGKYYYYSGETIMWNNQLCYVWDRYDLGLASETEDNYKYYECKILTNSLNLTLPFKISSPEFVASVTAEDNDVDYKKLAADVSEEMEPNYGDPYTRLIPEKYRGLRVLKREYDQL